MINEIRSKLNDYIGEEVIIKYNLGRNKFEKYNVIIKELYENVFLVELDTTEKKSFSYSDVITNTIKIDY
ncbi:MAG: Veg family protein [Bacilli bacterium]